MNAEARENWLRAKKALATATAWGENDPDAAASRAYYAAFYAITALFLLEGRSFVRHAGIEIAVHRDLIKSGRWEPALGAEFSSLLLLRNVGDYGGTRHASFNDARSAAESARRILAIVAQDIGERLDILELPGTDT